MKRLNANNSNHFAQLFEKLLVAKPYLAFEYLLFFFAMITESADVNILESNDLLDCANRFEAAMKEVFDSDALDDYKNLLMLLTKQPIDTCPEVDAISMYGHFTLQEGDGLLALALEHQVISLFGMAKVASVIDAMFVHSLWKDGSSYTQGKYLRSLPVFMLFLEFWSKFLFFIVVSTITIQDYSSNYGSDYEAVNHLDSTLNGKESFLVLLSLLTLFYEVGQVLDINAYRFMDKFLLYLEDDWNKLDFIRIIIVFGWMFARAKSSRVVAIRITLSLAAIPSSLSLLQHLSLFKNLGI
jgi:hypothetical protein